MSFRTEDGRMLLTTREASALSGLTHTHISDLARHGKIEALRVGHAWLIYEDALNAYLALPRKSGRPKGHQASRSKDAHVCA